MAALDFSGTNASFSHWLQGNIDISLRHSYNLRVTGDTRAETIGQNNPAAPPPCHTMSADNQSPYNATVIGREEINPQLVILRVRPDAEMFEFKPGQFGVLGLQGGAPRVLEAAPEEVPSEPDKLIRRAYSIASSSLERRYVEFYLTLITSGQLTPRLFALKHGSRVFLGPKASGIFTLDRVAPGKAVILVATGTGLAPYISMLRTMLVNDGERRFVVLHGARYGWDLGYRGELESLARLRPNFTYIPSITRPDQDPHFHGRTGRIQTLIEQGVLEAESGVTLDPTKAEVFLCGNPDMVNLVKIILEGKGFAAKNDKAPATIHVEEYW
jgi:ferredoxin--NADP+ reductase